MTLIFFLFAGTLWATHKNEVSSMNEKRVGKRTIALSHPPSVISYANIGGKQEAEGPLSSYFDELSDDSFFGEKRGGNPFGLRRSSSRAAAPRRPLHGVQ